MVYQVYPRSYADSNGDGVGDLPGATAHLDHIRRLGADAVWFSPFYRSPMDDFGYDISDHCDVDPIFGTMADADAMIATAHGMGLRVVLDVVPNHTSNQHPWFQASRSSPDDPLRGWYVWRDPAPDGGPPNNWRAAFADEPAWTFDRAGGQYYLHLFLPQQPDLDWNHPEVPKAMVDVLHFWLDRGADGFRVDVAHCIGKSPELPDAPVELAGLPASLLDHGPGVHVQLRMLRTVMDAPDGDRLLVGETYVFDRERVVSYLGHNDELHMGFNIPALHAPWTAEAWSMEIRSALDLYAPVDGWPSWVLSNHDVRRHRTRYGSEARARAAAVLLLTLRGTPFLYAGEELGLLDAEVPPERVVDPGGRDGCRAPIPWTAESNHGWPADPWLPFPPEAASRNVARQSGDPGSMFEHYRRLLALRHRIPALHRGRMELLDSPDGVVRWRRWVDEAGDQDETGVEILVNFTTEPVAVPHPAAGATWLGGTADPASPPDPADPLGPDEARIISVAPR